MATSTLTVIVAIVCSTITIAAAGDRDGRGGQWNLLVNSSSVVAMHMALTHFDTVVIFDQTSSSNRPAHSVEYDIATNSIRPLSLETDTWCSSGAFFSNGTLAQTGGYADGYRRIRYFDPCSDHRCDWWESKSFLADGRWYATNQVLPEKDRVFIVGGRHVFTYEFIPKSSAKEGAFNFPFLRETYVASEEGSNLYPFVHLTPGGNLFIFANRDAVLFNYRENIIIRRYPQMPGDGSRSYPNTGSSVMLPLEYGDGFRKVEIMVCGGARKGAYDAIKRGEFLEALSSCGRLVVTDKQPLWAMEEMPGRRLMSDMLLMPTGDVLIINGAAHGVAGWQKGRNPAYNPYLYKPKKMVGSRFSVLNPSPIPRMYHSSALVLPDGRVFVAGSNPYNSYNLTGKPYPTELRVEAFTPYYMSSFFDDKRPSNVSVSSESGEVEVKYGEEFQVVFGLQRRANEMEFNVYAPPFATHSVSMNQRLVKLECKSMAREKDGKLHAVVMAPPAPTVAPSGYYLLSVVNGGIPSKSVWLRFIHA